MAETTYSCDLCTHAPFKAPTALGRHKLSAHGIPGKSSSAVAYRKALAAQQKESTNGKHQQPPHHEPKKNGITAPLNSSKAIQKTHRQTDLIPEGALAVAFGRFQGLCLSFAYEYDLPPKLFASRLTQLISASAVR